MRLSIIVAMAHNRVIGRGGALPWRLSADLKRFKSLTMGHHLIMGRKTYDSIARPLPGRISIVLKRRASPYDYDFFDEAGLPRRLYKQARDFETTFSPNEPLPLAFAPSFDEALLLAGDDSEVFVIGGAQIYELALPLADRLYVTHVEAEVEGDTFFPAYDPADWRLVEETSHAADTKNEFPHRFCIYDRIKP
jgi:dihydrofolate reductase